MREHIKQNEKNESPVYAAALFYEMACFHARLGNKNQAFEYLDKSYEHRFGLLMIKADPFLDSLKNDPRFT